MTDVKTLDDFQKEADARFGAFNKLLSGISKYVEKAVYGGVLLQVKYNYTNTDNRGLNATEVRFSDVVGVMNVLESIDQEVLHQGHISRGTVIDSLDVFYNFTVTMNRAIAEFRNQHKLDNYFEELQRGPESGTDLAASKIVYMLEADEIKLDGLRYEVNHIRELFERSPEERYDSYTKHQKRMSIGTRTAINQVLANPPSMSENNRPEEE
jgi:hypothetical protein